MNKLVIALLLTKIDPEENPEEHKLKTELKSKRFKAIPKNK